jgi:hypothetical protein
LNKAARPLVVGVIHWPPEHLDPCASFSFSF